MLWSGSDDGLIYVSKDGGGNWENVTPKDCPQWMMWNCVETDPVKKGTAYFVGTDISWMILLLTFIRRKIMVKLGRK